MARSHVLVAALLLASGLASATRHHPERRPHDDGCDFKVPCTHTVVRGEDLWSIADRYGLEREAVAAANPHVHDPHAVRRGDTVHLPCELPTEGRSIADLLTQRPDLSILVQAAEAAGIVETLSERRLEATLFAPTNCAFAALLEQLGVTAEELLADKETLVRVLTYHVVPSVAAKAEDLSDGQELPTALEGQSLKVKLDRRHVFLRTTSEQEVKVIEADLEAGRSIIHVVEQVLLPGEEDHRPSPSPSHRPSPSPDHRPSPSPDHRRSPSPSHRPSPSPDHRPSPSPDHRPSPSPDHRPSPSPDHRPSPSPDHRPSPSPDHRPSPSPDHRPTPSPDHRPCTHTVVRGEYLYSIAQRYGTSVAELVRLNPSIRNPSLIYPGQEIILPC